jgi:phospholipid/cholesterol/gamma-HCH transport system substrate-binding protein
VPIGSGEDRLDPDGTGVLVTMSIRNDVRLPLETVAVASPESMFGDWQVELASKTSPDFAFFDYPEPDSSGVMPGYALPDISRLTAVAAQIGGNLDSLVNRFETAFTLETATNIAQAIENIEKVSAELTSMVSSQQTALDTVAANLSRTAVSAGQAAETLDRTFAEVEAAIADGRLTGIVENVRASSARADSLTTELMAASRDLRRMASGADTALRRVGTIAAAVEKGEGSLGRLLADTSLYYTLTESTVQLQALLKDIREHPRKYINLTIF